MNKSAVLFLVLLNMAFVCVINTQPVKANGIVTIMADGRIDPPTANITSVDNVTYALIGDIYGYLRVERNNTIVDGAGYTVTAGGIVLYYVSNVTVMNMEIKSSNKGVDLRYSSNNIITGNNITNNQLSGIYLDYSSRYNSLIGNNIAATNDYGISLGGSSNHNSIFGNDITNNYRGIYLGSSSNNVSGNTITGSSQYGITIDGDQHNNSITGNTITANGDGVQLYGASNNSISGNYIANNSYGVSLLSASSNNNVSGNSIVENNSYGIFLSASSDNSICVNTITNNTWGISGAASSNNSISGNTIIANRKCGIQLHGWSSANNISGNTITANYLDGDIYPGGGIEISGPLNNISKNTITENKGYGIWLSGLAASNNSVSENIITANKKHGIFLSGASNYNRISGNSIMNNEFGVFFSASSNNVFYHNTLVNNTQQGYTENSVNVWDDGYPSGGNFWSSYTGMDSNGDGIGDTPYVIDESNQDRYPLVAPSVWNYSTSIPIVSNGTVNWVSLSSNSAVSTFKFNQTQKQISFNVTGAPGTTGYCNITIPKQLMWAESGQWRVLVGGVVVTPTITEDANNTYLYFTYTHSTKIIEIKAASAGEEPQQSEPFPTTRIVAAIAIIAIAAATGYLFLKRKKQPNNLLFFVKIKPQYAREESMVLQVTSPLDSDCKSYPRFTSRDF